MKNEISFQQLRTPAAALASTAIVLSLLDTRDAGQHDTDTIGLMLTVIAISAALLGFLSRGSCRAQGLSGTVFAVIATAAAGLPETVEDADIHLSQAAPTLWALSGIMFGTAAATCLVQGGWYRRLIHREAPTTSLATTSVLGLLLGIAISLPLVSQPAVFTSLRADSSSTQLSTSSAAPSSPCSPRSLRSFPSPASSPCSSASSSGTALRAPCATPSQSSPYRSSPPQ